MIASPSDPMMKAAGWTETHGIALWTNPVFPKVLVDCNADVVAVYKHKTQEDVGSLDADNMNEEEIIDLFDKSGVSWEKFKY